LVIGELFPSRVEFRSQSTPNNDRSAGAGQRHRRVEWMDHGGLKLAGNRRVNSRIAENRDESRACAQGSASGKNGCAVVALAAREDRDVTVRSFVAVDAARGRIALEVGCVGPLQVFLEFTGCEADVPCDFQASDKRIAG
jgi:hypothetical protein